MVQPGDIGDEDVCLWPHGAWCYGSELSEMSHLSDDFAVVPRCVDLWLLIVEGSAECKLVEGATSRPDAPPARP
jgi:hypothetical protein